MPLSAVRFTHCYFDGALRPDRLLTYFISITFVLPCRCGWCAQKRKFRMCQRHVGKSFYFGSVRK